MKKLIIFIIIFAFFSSSITVNNKIIKIAVSEFTPAYSKNSKEMGYICHIMKEVFAIAGYKVQFSWMPWKRVYLLTKNGEYDVAGAWFKTKERINEGMQFSDPFEKVSTNFFYLKEKKFDWNTYKDLKGLIIGITIGFTYPNDFIKASNKGLFKIDKTSEEILNIRKLLNKRIDLFPAGPIPTYSLLRKYFSKSEINKLTYHPKPLIIDFNYIMFSPHISKEIIYDFNKALKKFKLSGKFNKIIKDTENGIYSN